MKNERAGNQRKVQIWCWGGAGRKSRSHGLNAGFTDVLLGHDSKRRIAGCCAFKYQ